MRSEFSNILVNQHDEPEDLNPWQWNAANVDFGRVPNYDTPRHAPYDPDFMPFWKEPQEASIDPAVREVWILKDERSGASENIALNRIRYAIGAAPESILYLSGDQKLTEGFLKRRIKRGKDLSPVLARRFAESASEEHTIDFGDMDLTITWPKSATAFKQDGYPLVIGDELSLWAEGGPEGMRGRTGSYNYSHIIGISSLDWRQKRGTESDPIWVEFMAGDRRFWFCQDPLTGRSFRFVFGSPESPYGLKWSKKARREDGSWNLEKVRSSAFYLTPDGTIIKNKDRLAVVKKGKWKPTNRKAPKNVRSYHMNAFCSPFDRGDFGEIAVGYLIAKSKGKEYQRAYVYNVLADEWKDDVERANEEVVKERRAKYERGERFTQSQSKMKDGDRFANFYLKRDTRIYLTADVQQDYQPVVIREFVDSGDSGLIFWDNTASFSAVAKLCDEYKVDFLGVDYKYKGRRLDTLSFCAELGGIPLAGSDNLDLPYMKKIIDPREGARGQGKNSITSYTFNTGTFRSILLTMLRGESEQRWYTYYRQEHAYIRQVSSTECVQGKWSRRPGYGQDHLFDCEVMQIVLAAIDGFYVFDYSYGD